jgi:hypothetical protein
MEKVCVDGLKECVFRLGTREPQKALPMPPRNLFGRYASPGLCIRVRMIERFGRQ